MIYRDCIKSVLKYCYKISITSISGEYLFIDSA